MDNDYLKYLKYKKKYLELKTQIGGCYGSPNRNFEDHNFNDNDNVCKTKNCSICLETLDNDLVKTTCGHIYHNNCLIDWYKKKQTCPLCNEELLFYYLQQNNRWIVNNFLNVITEDLRPQNLDNDFINPQVLQVPRLERPNRQVRRRPNEEDIRNYINSLDFNDL